ncbi:hypothetical protein J3E64_001549 [Sphingobium sp. OAS761]|uniref:hypothetical protein n=1 Tax=Sphingobium sp. OAS761 TaxID=2817901 RepID=UPI00209CA3C5|nr:hypothetical protein [Sphingobium sp. OAS761]MCP1469867.1 hypothetical protein [Sphingobium sp. OAS761]
MMRSQTRQEAVNAREAAIVKRYAPLKERVFGNPNWYELEAKSRGLAKASFRLDINFNKAAYITAYDFLVELNQIFSKAILPVRIDNGCINIIAQFEDSADFEGIDFREKVFTDPDYQDILSAYAVSAIDFYGFPVDARFPSSHVAIDEQGKPALA